MNSSGRIVDIGAGVRGYTLGQRVSRRKVISCAVCVAIVVRANSTLCPHTIGIGVSRNGAFAEYIAMPASNLWPIPDQIPSELAAFFDPYGNATHCALEFDLIGEDVLITGARVRSASSRPASRNMSARAMSSSPTSTTTV